MQSWGREKDMWIVEAPIPPTLPHRIIQLSPWLLKIQLQLPHHDHPKKMSFTGLSTLNKRAVWSSLPPLRTHAILRTKNISRSRYKLHENQVSQWTDF